MNYKNVEKLNCSLKFNLKIKELICNFKNYNYNELKEGHLIVAFLFFKLFDEKIMEGSVYSNLGLKMNRTFREKREEEVFTLKDFLEHKWTLTNNEELKRTFARELKIVLQKENLFDLINSFFELESDLHHVLDQVEFEVSILNFDEFYKNLSPVLMRSLLENSQAPDNAALLLQSIKESLRIALEEELYQLEDHF